ncbi:MAG TPA: amidohydrolase family protein [Polyangiales bacterium]
MASVDFPIVDPHVHHWDPYTTPRADSPLARLLRPWPDAYARLTSALMPRPLRASLGKPDYVLRPYLPADRSRDAKALRTEAMVHVQAEWLGFGPLAPVGETRWLETLGYADAGTRLAAIVARADLRSPRAGEVLDAHLTASNKVRGIRDMAAHHPDRGVHAWAKRPDLLRDKDFLRGFEQLHPRKLRFDACVYSLQLPDVTALAQRFAQTPIVLDHVGTPVGAAGPFAGVGHSASERDRIVGSWREDLARLAECKNVHVKLSGLVMPVLGFDFHKRSRQPDASELVDKLGPYLRHALDVFGVERCFFASNFPMDKVSASYVDLFDAYAQIAAERGPQALRALLRDNALKFYGA